MHLDYRGGSQAIISTGLTTRHSSLHRCPKKRLVFVFSVCHVALWLSHLQCLCVHAMVLLSALEGHGILFACWSVVNSNGNGLAGSPLSARLGGEKGREEGIWGLRGREAEVWIEVWGSSCSRYSMQKLNKGCFFSFSPQQDTVFLFLSFFLEPSAPSSASFMLISSC